MLCVCVCVCVRVYIRIQGAGAEEGNLGKSPKRCQKILQSSACWWEILFYAKVTVLLATDSAIKGASPWLRR